MLDNAMDRPEFIRSLAYSVLFVHTLISLLWKETLARNVGVHARFTSKQLRSLSLEQEKKKRDYKNFRAFIF